MLLTEFKVDVNARNLNGATPLHRASQAGDLNCAQDLLEKSADASLCDKGGKKPIDVAASAEMKELIQGLLDITEEYICELQKKIEEADREHDETVELVSLTRFYRHIVFVTWRNHPLTVYSSCLSIPSNSRRTGVYALLHVFKTRCPC
jgi:hypothetical protein